MRYFSEELRISDPSLAKYMIEEQQKEFDANPKIIDKQKKLDKTEQMF